MDFSELSEGLKVAVDGVSVGQVVAYSMEKDTTDPENLLPYTIKITLRQQPPATVGINFFSNAEHKVAVTCNGRASTYQKCKVLKFSEEWGPDRVLYQTLHFYAPSGA